MKKKNKSGSEAIDWHISDLKIYDEPKEISEFRKPDEKISGTSEQNGHTVFYDGYINGEVLKKPPQSWCYVEKIE